MMQRKKEHFGYSQQMRFLFTLQIVLKEWYYNDQKSNNVKYASKTKSLQDEKLTTSWNNQNFVHYFNWKNIGKTGELWNLQDN